MKMKLFHGTQCLSGERRPLSNGNGNGNVNKNVTPKFLMTFLSTHLVGYLSLQRASLAKLKLSAIASTYFASI